MCNLQGCDAQFYQSKESKLCFFHDKLNVKITVLKQCLRTCFLFIEPPQFISSNFTKIILIGVLHLPPICMTILKCSSDNFTVFENNHDHVTFYHLTTGVNGLRSIYGTADCIPSNFLRAVFHKFYLARSGILCPKCNFNLPCSCRSQLNSAGT